MMKRKICLAVLSALALGGCMAKKALVNNAQYPAFDREAHRGGRGLMPENTIPAMLNAVDLGVETLEMDTHITADGQVVVSHDEYINPLFSLLPGGSELAKDDAKKYVFYQMRYADIARFDVGSKPYSKFPRQKKMAAHIPLLATLIDSVQQHLKTTGKKQVLYNIETKSSAKGDGTLNPDPATFVNRLMAVLSEKHILPYVVIQSFDPRTIRLIHKQYPGVRTSWLVDNKKTTAGNLAELGYKPYIYSPNYKMVTAGVVNECHAQGIKVIPWTPNTKEEIAVLKALGVDGIITDYPDYFN